LFRTAFRILRVVRALFGIGLIAVAGGTHCAHWRSFTAVVAWRAAPAMARTAPSPAAAQSLRAG
jgi:hypothetical protein